MRSTGVTNKKTDFMFIEHSTQFVDKNYSDFLPEIVSIQEHTCDKSNDMELCNDMGQVQYYTPNP